MDTEVIKKTIGTEGTKSYGTTNKFFLLQFTKKQIVILLFYGLANIFRAAIALIGGPFYPPEASAKGATATEIGIVFAAQDFTVFFMSFLYGKKLLNSIGPQRVVGISFLGIGICAILFGCTVLIEDRTLFIGVSILVRVITGIFDGGIYPAVFTIYSLETPGSISTAIAIFEVFFGIGAIGGPVLCGLLMDAVGFTLTYAIVGCCIIASTIAIFLFVPKVQRNSISAEALHRDEENTDSKRFSRISHPGFLRLLTIPTVLLVIFSLSTASASIGFITATLSLHYDDLSPAMSGAVFSTGTALYTIFCPVWGYVADHRIISKSMITILAALILIIGFSVLGPLPFLPYESTTWTAFVGYSVMSIGIGGSIMTAYHHSLEAAVAEGFPDDSITYGLVSSLYIATFSFGNTIGPTVSGILYDNVGFRMGTMFIIGLATLVIIAAVLLRVVNLKKRIDRI